MKKLIALIMCFMMLICSYPAVFASENELLDKSDIDLLYLIDVIDKKDFTDTELSEGVTRANFLLYVAKSLGMEEQPEFEKNYFADLESHWISKLANKFVDMGIISVGDDRLFNPDRRITSDEAAKILVCVLGYDNLAKVNGGFPTGYMLLANRLEIIKPGISQSLNLAGALKMIALYVEAPLYQIEKIKNDTVYYEQSDEESILSLYHSLDFSEGYVVGVQNSSFDDASDGFEVMYIADEKYVIDKDFEYPYSYLGSYVKVYFDNTYSSKKVAKLCVALDNSSIIEIDAKDIDYLDSSYRLWYFKEDSDKSYSEKLDRGIKVIYNGILNTDDITAMFSSLKNGKVRLVDADENGYYEYCVVTNYKDFAVSQVDAENEIIYDKINGDIIDLKNFEFAGIYNDLYEKETILAIRENTILSVAQSSDNKTYAEIVISKNSISGTVEEMSEENDKTSLKINGEFYDVSDDYIKNNKVKAGIKGTFYLNIFGKVTFIDIDPSADYHYGYLCKGERARDINPNAVQLEIFGDDSDLKMYYIYENVVVDGSKCKKIDNILTALKADSDDVIAPQLIRYKLNDEGVITHIDTTEHNTDFENTSDALVSTTPKDDSESSANGQRIFTMSTNVKRIGTDVLFDKGTILFFIPALSNIKNGDYTAYDFQIAEFADMVTDTAVLAEGYKSDIKSVCEDAVVCYGQNTSLGNYYDDNTNLFVVKDIKQAVDDEGFSGTKVYGLRGSSEEGYFVSDDYLSAFNAMKITEGDLLAIGTGNDGKINDIHLLYDFSQGGEPKKQTNSKWYDANRYLNNYNNFSLKFSCSFMYAGYKEGNLIKGFYNTEQNFIKESDESVDTTNKKIIVVDKNRTDGNKVYFGTIADINDADSVGVANCSKIFVHYRYITVKDIIVYK